MEKPKEFWIHPSKIIGEEEWAVSVDRINPDDQNQEFIMDITTGIRVIEYQAYEKLMTALKRFRGIEDALEDTYADETIIKCEVTAGDIRELQKALGPK